MQGKKRKKWRGHVVYMQMNFLDGVALIIQQIPTFEYNPQRSIAYHVQFCDDIILSFHQKFDVSISCYLSWNWIKSINNNNNIQ